MKKIAILLLSALCGYQLAAQHIQATIKPNGSNPRAVDVYFTPDFTNSTNYFDNLTISVAIPASVSPVPSAVITTGSGINAMTWNSTYADGTHTEASAPYNTYRYYTFITNSPTATPVSLVAGTEILAATITFSGSASANSSQVSLVSLDNINGGNNLQTYTYIQLNILSQVSPDPTTGGVLFYNTPGVSTTGQFEAGSPMVTTNSLINLPVKLASFYSDVNKCNATLRWLTIEEVNVDHFEIEQSTDGVHFTKTGEIKPSGISTGSNYNFNVSPAAALTYYRLKIVDRNNEAEYGNIIKVKTNCSGTVKDATIAPNPASAQQGININLQGYTGTIYATLLSIEGKVISKTKLVNGNGSNKLDATQLAAGTYLVTITDSEGNTSTQKVIVNR